MLWSERNGKTVPMKSFPNCCLVCKHGKRYYRGIDCNKEGNYITDINDICDLFERQDGVKNNG